MPPRPVRQLQVLDALRAAYERTGATPELTALSRTLGISYSTLREHLRALETKGELLLESRGPGRSPRLTLLGGGFGVPLYGEIAAGLPVGVYPTPEGHLALRGRPDQFALRVRGDSMADRIEDGDVVLLHRAEPQRPGEVCAVRVGEDETTLKYLDWPVDEPRPHEYRLRPHNPAFPVITVDAQDLHVDGVFRGLLRGDIVQDLIIEGSE
ncbi:MAG: S24 family peptidase [Trueperaceae bacterium]|jgi:repressor LexA|nr:S24 family peptidase [Trueperaceae bacterium]HRQ11126.1 S24 family peptidase [Trueperaceae bacterium]